MKVASYFKISSRFVRRILFLSSFTLLILTVTILFVRTLQTSSNPSQTIAQNVPQVNTPSLVTKTSQLTNEKEKKVIKHELPLIYEPASDLKVSRALLTFYPNDQKDVFAPEVRWFYRSWIEMMTNESSLWRTDFIIYTTEYEQMFKDLGCVYDQIRLNFEEKPTCRIFPYIRIKNRVSKHEPSSKYQIVDKQRSELLHRHLRDYGYIDSINTVFEYNSSYSMYNYVLRTDLDCFLTKNFARYVPYEDTLLVGHGGYSTPFNNKRFKRIAHDMNWGYADKNGLGSTWYGPASMTNHLANYTLHAMVYLSLNEFTTPEREQKLGVMLWPEWHYGVLLLYGGHLAINHLMASENFNIGHGGELLDQGVTSTDKEDISKNHRLHLHCWHGDQPFSKFSFKAGQYNKINSSTLISDTSASGYAMRLALEAQSMKLEELKQMLLNIKK